MDAAASTLHPILFIGAGPGDPELITIKGRRLLDEADLVVYAGSLVNPELLTGIRATCLDSAAMTLDEIMLAMTKAQQNGLKVVRLHTGDPAMYGAIREQMQILDQLDLPCAVVPGVSSVFAAAASLKKELTVPERTQTVILTRQAGRTPVPERESLRNLATIRATMCIFLSAAMIGRVTEDLLAGGYPPETPVAVVERASWPDERTVRGDLSNIAGKMREAGISKTAMILVGPALDEEPAPASRLYDAAFAHEYRDCDKS